VLLAAAALPPAPAAATLAMIRDVRAAIATEGPALWPGFNGRSVEVDVIDGDREYLLCRPPFADFVARGRDPVTGCVVSERRRALDADLSASFPVAPGVQVIAVGTPAVLRVDAPTWRLILLHEAFHQYQARGPRYRRALAHMRRILGRRADWVLAYPFPYGRPATVAAFSAMGAAARDFIAAPAPRASRLAVRRYVAARRRAAATMSPADWQYYEFQVGQEGVARWTEIALGKRMRQADPGVATVAADHRLGLATSLRAIDAQGLAVWKRSAFYVFGAVEADMLDRHRKGWRARYLRRPFAIGEQLAEIR